MGVTSVKGRLRDEIRAELIMVGPWSHHDTGTPVVPAQQPGPHAVVSSPTWSGHGRGSPPSQRGRVSSKELPFPPRLAAEVPLPQHQLGQN